ncbi:MAG: tRNA pseudouridine(55) synthase TruB [Gemmatimonadaceae bacterium]|nr:tRNA pseudouridine(55) synthase TruB [Gemmatimonadaceae bacterium]
MTMTTAATDGLLLLDKPAGISSHDAVLAARRALHEKRIGHAGTLDPFATGLLVLLTGRATRLLPYLPGEPKVYEATIQFGRETDTEDLLGAVTREAPPPSEAAVRAALPALTGVIQQVPPAYSAKRIDGQRAYEAARAGVMLDLKPVSITVHSWDLLAWHGDRCDVRIVCGGGTYVRSLARDLARAVGSAAHLSALRRVAAGAFAVRDAQAVLALRDTPPQLRPPLDAVPHLPQVPLTHDEVHRIRRGLDIAITAVPDRPVTHVALVSADHGGLVALGERIGDRWQPRVVMRDA